MSDEQVIPIGAGRGKYDDACTEARAATQAKACALLVVGGHAGGGFSVQSPLLLMPVMADLLEAAAAQLRQDLTKFAPGGKTPN